MLAIYFLLAGRRAPHYTDMCRVQVCKLCTATRHHRRRRRRNRIAVRYLKIMYYMGLGLHRRQMCASVLTHSSQKPFVPGSEWVRYVCVCVLWYNNSVRNDRNHYVSVRMPEADARRCALMLRLAKQHQQPSNQQKGDAMLAHAHTLDTTAIRIFRCAIRGNDDDTQTYTRTQPKNTGTSALAAWHTCSISVLLLCTFMYSRRQSVNVFVIKRTRGIQEASSCACVCVCECTPAFFLLIFSRACWGGSGGRWFKGRRGGWCATGYAVNWILTQCHPASTHTAACAHTHAINIGATVAVAVADVAVVVVVF